MAVSKSSLKRRGKVFYLRFSENATRKRISLHTNSRETAKELQRRFCLGSAGIGQSAFAA